MPSLKAEQHANVEQLLQKLQLAGNANTLATLGATRDSILLALDAFKKTQEQQTNVELFNQVPIGLIFLDHGLRVVATNDFGRNIFSGFSPWIDSSQIDLILKTKSFQSMLSSGVQRFLLWIQKGCDGPLQVALLSGAQQQSFLLHGFSSGHAKSSTYFISMTPHNTFSNQLKELTLYQHAFNAVDYPLMILSKNGMILFANPYLSFMTGISQDELIGRQADHVLSPSHDRLFSELERWVDDYNSWKKIINVKTSASLLLKVQVSISGFKQNKDKTSEHFIVSMHDMSDTIDEQQRLAQLANTDGLTGLSNRLHFSHVFEEKLKRARREGSHLTLFFIDLNKFKSLNDEHGHQFGDMLLIAISQRIQRNIRDHDFVARIGGDEFALLMTGDLPQNALEGFAHKLLSHLNEPYYLDDIRYESGMSIGAACYPYDGLTQEELLHNADIAMYSAKSTGMKKCQFFHEQLLIESSLKNKFEDDLEKALHFNGFELYFQPQHNLSSGDIVGFEALIRLKNSEKKDINIDQFISEAERSGLIIPLGKKILQLAFHHIKAWVKRGLNIPIAINLSAIQLKDPSTLQNIRKLAAQFPECVPLVHFEITETSFFERSLEIETVINELSELGITMALDDFGTGYSSIYSLKKFPFKIIKTDGSFVNAITQGDGDDRLILSTMIEMINSLGLEIVAEGIETQEQLDFLIKNDCAVGQGFLFSKAMPATEVMKYINKQSFKHPPEAS